MQEIKQCGAQGDVLFRRVPTIPKDATEQKDKGPVIVAHSETGHHHTIAQAEAKLFTSADPFVCYLRLAGEHADVVHHRPHDTHETLRLVGERKGGACFEVRRQREHTPEGWRMVQD